MDNSCCSIFSFLCSAMSTIEIVLLSIFFLPLYGLSLELLLYLQSFTSCLPNIFQCKDLFYVFISKYYIFHYITASTHTIVFYSKNESSRVHSLILQSSKHLPYLYKQLMSKNISEIIQHTDRQLVHP
jgi:hypothetical protein